MSLDLGVEVPFVTHLGFRLHRFEGGEAESSYEERAEHFNAHGVTHGGAHAAGTLRYVRRGGVAPGAAESAGGIVTD